MQMPDPRAQQHAAPAAGIGAGTRRQLRGTGATDVGGVSPIPQDAALSSVRGAGALTRSAGIGAAALFGGGTVLALVLEEVLQLDAAPLEPLFAAAVAGAAIAGPVAAAGGQLRVALERWLLLRAAERAVAERRPPAAERIELRRGPHDRLRALGLGLLLAAFVLGMFASALWEREAWAWAGRGALPALSCAAVLIGAPLAIVSRRRSRARDRWAARVDALEARWSPGVRPEPRAPRPRSARLLGGAGRALLVGTVVLAIPVLMRKPNRYADPIRYDEPVERFIDGVLLLGALVIVLAALALAAGRLVSLAWRWAEDRSTLRGLERGEGVPAGRLDVMLLDRSAGEGFAQAVGLAGWLLLAPSLAPAATAALVSQAAAVPLAPLALLLLPAVVLLLLSWLLGAIATRGAASRRARIHRLVARDPLPADGGEPATLRGPGGRPRGAASRRP